MNEIDREKGEEDAKIVCRCNDVTEEEVLEAIESGITDLELLRKELRIGMGPCQGRTCIPLLASILSRETSRSIESMPLPKSRSPLVPVPVNLLKSSGGNEE